MEFSRRHWLSHCVAAGVWADIARTQQHAHAAAKSQGTQRFYVFSQAEAAEIDALTAQILPSDDGPGAREAGVVYFIDQALSSFDAAQRGLYRTGMDALQQQRRTMFPESSAIAGLSGEEQIELIRSIEHTTFFELLRTHTLLGFLGNPEYGGNRGEVGWKHIGFVHEMSFQPPFGYYDQQSREVKE